MSKLCTTHVHLSYRGHACDGLDRKKKMGRMKEAYMVQSRNAVEKWSLGSRREETIPNFFPHQELASVTVTYQPCL